MSIEYHQYPGDPFCCGKLLEQTQTNQPTFFWATANWSWKRMVRWSLSLECRRRRRPTSIWRGLLWSGWLDVPWGLKRHAQWWKSMWALNWKLSCFQELWSSESASCHYGGDLCRFTVFCWPFALQSNNWLMPAGHTPSLTTPFLEDRTKGTTGYPRAVSCFA